MKISMFIGDIADAPAEAICTSTNPRLSLMMGSGGSVRDRGGFDVHKQCEVLLAQELAQSGRERMRVGTVHVTTAGSLPQNIVIHCVASDANHRSSVDIISACVINALVAAESRSCRSIAMPVFAAGHAHFRFSDSLKVIAATLKGSTTSLERAVIVIYDPDRAEEARRVLSEIVSLE